MIDNPLEKVAEYAAVGSDIISIIPACPQPHRVCSTASLTNANDPARGIIRGWC
jgi:hypothetical protein